MTELLALPGNSPSYIRLIPSEVFYMAQPGNSLCRVLGRQRWDLAKVS